MHILMPKLPWLSHELLNKIKAFFKKIFIQHPIDVGETYLQHFLHASYYGIRIVLAGIICLVHALIPGILTFTASSRIRVINEELSSRSKNIHDNN